MTNRLAVLAAYLETRGRRFRDRDALERWQARRLDATLERARRVFPHYRDVPQADLSAFPVIGKADWLEHFAELNTLGLGLAECLAAGRDAEAARAFTARLRGVSIGLSSGTSGRQGVFLTSPAEQARWAGTILAKALPRGLLGGARVALLLRSGGPLYEAVGGGRISFRYLDLARPLDDHVAALNEFAPTVLAAPPQALEFLAAALASGALRIRPEQVFSLAEVLEPHVRSAVETAFGLALGEIYQATEGFLGITCDHGSLHLNEDLLLVEEELVDTGSGRYAPVITDLYRRTQAVIRYRLGDLLVRGGDCRCGSPFRVVDRIEGRSDDVLLLPDSGGVLRPLFADFARGAVLGVPGVADFRLVQEAPGLVRLAVRPGERFADAAAALRRWIGRSGLVEPIVLAGEFEDFRPEVKLRRVRRAFPAGPGSSVPSP
ncbi:MAG: F390 synthetase-related protein [Candidatus Nanopelagicales bacterium]